MKKVNIYIMSDGTSGADIKQLIIKLCMKVYAEGYRTLFLCNSGADVGTVDSLLWTATGNFIPHGTEESPFKLDHPIYIADVFCHEYAADCVMMLNITDHYNISESVKHGVVVHICETAENLCMLQRAYCDHQVNAWQWRHDKWCSVEHGEFYR